MEITLFYVPCPTQENALSLVSELLESKLVACGNVHQSESLYQWNGVMNSEMEWVAIMKTLPALAGQTEAKILDLHPYDTPAVLHWQVACNATYHEWVTQQLIIVPLSGTH